MQEAFLVRCLRSANIRYAQDLTNNLYIAGRNLSSLRHRNVTKLRTLGFTDTDRKFSNERLLIYLCYWENLSKNKVNQLQKDML